VRFRQLFIAESTQTNLQQSVTILNNLREYDSHAFKIKTMKKLTPIFLVVVCINTTISCKKETIVKETETLKAVASQSISSNSLINTKANFGVLVTALSGDDKITVAKLLGVKYVRQSLILKDFTGELPLTDKYLSNGFKVILNLNYKPIQNYKGERVPKLFPTDMIEYRNTLNKVFDKYTPEIAVIENEPLNDNHYKDTIENYIRELKNAVEVCNQRGIKVADGGAFSAQTCCILVYKDYFSRGMQAEADDFAKRAGMEDRFIKAAKGKGSNQRLLVKIREAEKMVKADAALNLDFVNIHWYEPLSDYNDPRISAPGVLKEVADYFRRKTGKKIITNEYGQLNDKPALTTSMIDAFRSANFKYAIIYSGTDADGLRTTQSLNDGILLTLIGEAFALAMIL